MQTSYQTGIYLFLYAFVCEYDMTMDLNSCLDLTLSDGLQCGTVNQINPFFPKLFPAGLYTATEMKLGCMVILDIPQNLSE